MAKGRIHHAKIEDLVLPGQTLRDILEFNKYDMEEFLELVELTQEDIDALLEGEKQFDEEISEKLSRKIKLPEDYWVNLQRNFNDEKARILKKEQKRAAQAKLNNVLSSETKE